MIDVIEAYAAIAALLVIAAHAYIRAVDRADRARSRKTNPVYVYPLPKAATVRRGRS